MKKELSPSQVCEVKSFLTSTRIRAMSDKGVVIASNPLSITVRTILLDKLFPKGETK